MPKRLFDSSIIIDHWHAFPDGEEKTEAALRKWGDKLVEIHSTRWICTPVLIEVLAGTRDQRDLALHRAYLSAFSNIDDFKIPPADWEKAKQLAQRVSAHSSVKARDLGDCLIRAIADRFNCEVLAMDKWYKRNR